MRIPSRAEFSPLPEVIDLLRLPDPLAVLPQLENHLEAVAGSTAQLRECLDVLREAIGDLGAQANAVAWRGGAANQFRSTAAELMSTLRRTADSIDSLASEAETTADGIRRAIYAFLIVVGAGMVVVGLIVGFLGVVAILSGSVAASVAVVMGVIGTIMLAAAALLDEIEDFGRFLRELAEFAGRETRRELERLRDWATGRRDPIWWDPEPPGRWAEPEATI